MDTKPLDRHQIYAGTDVDETRAVISHLFTENRIAPLKGGQPIRDQINGIELSRSTICYVEFASGLLSTPIAPMNCHTIQYPITGQAEFNIEGRATAVTSRGGAMVSAGQQLEQVMLTPGTGVLCFNIGPTEMRNMLTAAIGRNDLPDLRFEPEIEWATPGVAAILTYLHSFASELNRPNGILETPKVLAGLEQAMITLMLYGLKHNLSEALLLPDLNAGLNKVRMVEEYIVENAAEPIDMQTIAQVTGHSANSIYRAFQKYRDYTPTHFLRTVRLDMVREHLLLNQPPVSISKIAMDCGFSHMGRFSKSYKERFGESPKDTVRQATTRHNEKTFSPSRD